MARFAFIVLPILAIFLYTLKAFDRQHRDEGTRVKTQDSAAKTLPGNTVGAPQ